ncbi:MAG: D-2-hydroxyacid dehydrogenase [Candidatus Aenigmarchaeota archaeon]|nr:D-2-hydroxyacid dehydrogenase [Candidatus Aenigmarchaeota archaeon]
MNILISDPFSKDLPDRLKEFGEVTDDRNEIPNANVMLVRSATKVNREMIDSAKNLKLVIRGGVGVDNIDVEYCKEKGIEVRNTPEASSIAVAELTFAIMLSIQRNIVKAHNSTKNNEWLKKQLKGRELYGKTLGLVGIGRIGTEVAKRAKAFGMNVIATRESEEQSEYAEIVDLDELLEKSDFISFHVPLTEETKGMVNKETIEKMKDGVVIINNARGKVVNENDLAEALKSGKVGYAGIDVYQQEPPEGSPLLSVENILLTPHIGAQTYENMDRIGDIVYEIIKEFAGSQH